MIDGLSLVSQSDRQSRLGIDRSGQPGAARWTLRLGVGEERGPLTLTSYRPVLTDKHILINK